MRKGDSCERKSVYRKEMIRESRQLSVLDDDTSYSRFPHASAKRAFVDWAAVAKSVGHEKFHLSPPISVGTLGEVVVVQDDGSLSLQSGELNYHAVWEQVRLRYGDQFDFVTFFTDFPVPIGYSFWSALYFKTEGISPDPPMDRRATWNTNRLQGFHFINPTHVDNMGVYLQEFGHQWTSYVYYADAPDSDVVYADLLLDGEPGHWDFYMDDGHSPMNYDFQFTSFMSTHWQRRQGDPALFDYHPTETIEYCDLDLYLMGLKEPQEVAPCYFILGPQRVGLQTWTGQRFEVTADMVVNAMGPRSAPAGLRENDFRNAWILVTRNATTGMKAAAHIDDVRRDFEIRYHVATHCLGRVDTKLPPEV